MLGLLPVWLACASITVTPVDPPVPEEPMFGIVDPAAFKPAGPLVYEQVFLPPAKFGPRDAATYMVRLYGPEMERSVEVLCNGERVFALKGMRTVLYEELDRSEPHPAFGSLREAGSFDSEEEELEYERSIVVGRTGVTPRTDVTGDGVPELVIGDLNGCSHTLFERFIFELWPRFRRLSVPDTWDGERLALADVDGDGAFELVTTVNPMISWTVATFETPFESVVLRFDGEGWVPAPQLMQQPPWSDEVIAARARAIRDHKDWTPLRPHGPAALWQQLLTLCMDGNAAQAWKLLEWAWPGDAASREAYRAEFEQELGSNAFGALMLQRAKSAALGRILPPDARRVFQNPSPQPGQAAERVVEIRGARSGCARPAIRVLEQGKRMAEEHGRTSKWMLSNLGVSSGASGTDLDGDGQDELVVAEWDDHSGVAAMASMSLYRVWPKFERIESVPWDPRGPGVFVNLDDDPAVELRVAEQLHGLWAGVRQHEPTPPTVLLKLKDGRYVPSAPLMAALAPSAEEVRAMALSFRAQIDADPEGQPVALWTEMLRLAYSGNMRSALELFDQAWPPERDDKASALAGFHERLRQGRYAPGVFGFGAPVQPEAGNDES